MKKLAVVLALVLSGFVNSQVENYTIVNWSYLRYQQKLLKENNFTSWCNADIRDAYETNNFDYLNQFSKKELLGFDKIYKNFIKVHGKTVQPVRDLSTMISYNDYLDGKINYEPILDLTRLGNKQITEIIPIKSLMPKYLILELVQMYVIDHEQKCVVILTSVFGQLQDGMWIVCDDYLIDETLELPQSLAW
jgi:hypothetical protein